MFNATEHG